MELDDLKYQLINKLGTDHGERSAGELAALLSKRTISITGKLLKSLRFEIRSCIVIILLFGYLGVASHLHSFRVYFSVFAVASVIFLAITISLYKRVQRLSSTSLPVKSNLQIVVQLIERFSRRYFQITMSMLPITLSFIFILAYSDKPHLTTGSKLFHAVWQVVLFVIVYIGVMGVAIYYFTRWYLRKLYDRYVVQLKGCIAELEESGGY